MSYLLEIVMCICRQVRKIFRDLHIDSARQTVIVFISMFNFLELLGVISEALVNPSSLVQGGLGYLKA